MTHHSCTDDASATGDGIISRVAFVVMIAAFAIALSGILVCGYQIFYYFQTGTWFRITVVKALDYAATYVGVEVPWVTWIAAHEILSTVSYAPTAFLGGIILCVLAAKRHD